MLSMSEEEFIFQKMACEQTIGIHVFRRREIDQPQEGVSKTKSVSTTLQKEEGQGVLVNISEGYSLM